MFRVPSWASSLSWGLLAAAALLWPGRISGPLDGVPLDDVAKAVVVGLLFPLLWWFHPRFLWTRTARACIVAMLAWKAFTTMALVQDGWCITFVPTEPLVIGGARVPHSWDIRADWRATEPSCSAIMTHSYHELAEFPAWFFNLPPPNDSWPRPTDRPPGATVGMVVQGFFGTRQPGVLRIVTGPDVDADVSVDGNASREALATGGVSLAPGIHRIRVDATLTGNRWALVPLWNGADLWSSLIVTKEQPSAVDLAVYPWAAWIAPAVIAIWGLGWVFSVLARVKNIDVIAWTIGSCFVIGLFAATRDGALARSAVIGLAGAAALRVPARLRNIFGAFALIGLPWMTLIAVTSAPLIGHFTLYDWGNDYWTFQRFAYRIFMQGYWLEGGSPTFWFQPFYRWIVGALHLIYGDSSVGEWYWDGACVLAMALFSFHVTKAFAGFRWGVLAAVTMLTVFALGPNWGFIGRGLSEISSAGLMYVAALFALRSRAHSWRWATLAGVAATLAFYSRLNNLPMAFAVVLFAMPLGQAVRAISRPAAWLSRVSWVTVVGVSAMVGLGMFLLALRTWHYTGVFSVFYGTQRDSLAIWQPGMSLGAVLTRMVGSLMMVLTMNDPARFDPYALPLLVGALASVLAVARVPALRELPLGLVLFSLAALSGSLIARGSAYPGRFSIHVIAVTTTVTVCAVSRLWRGRNPTSHRLPLLTARSANVSATNTLVTEPTSRRGLISVCAHPVRRSQEMAARRL